MKAITLPAIPFEVPPSAQEPTHAATVSITGNYCSRLIENRNKGSLANRRGVDLLIRWPDLAAKQEGRFNWFKD